MRSQYDYDMSKNDNREITAVTLSSIKHQT